MSEMSDDKKDPRHDKMLAALSQGMTWEEAAESVGVSERTLRRWCQADAGLAMLASKARESADDMVQAVTFMNCLDPDPAHNSLRMFWLKCRRPDVFRDKAEINVLSRLPEDELIRRATGAFGGDRPKGIDAPLADD